MTRIRNRFLSGTEGKVKDNIYDEDFVCSENVMFNTHTSRIRSENDYNRNNVLSASGLLP
eukprot:scaffold64968_cov70-Cyclotella_meneghiniana.AAC.8